MSFIGRHWYSAILILALVLRLVNLGGPSLWYDECLTARLTWLVSPGQIMAGTALDVHPPLYYLLIAGWRRAAGASEFALRFPSVVFGMVALVLWYHILQRLNFPPKAVALSLFLMALSPSLIFYAQETRMYSLLIFAVSLALWGVVSDQSLWLIMGGSTAMYSQNMAWAYMLSLGILALIRGWPIRKLAVASVTIAILYLPWIWRLIDQVSELNNGYWVPSLSLGSLIYSMYPLVWFFAVPKYAAIHASLLALGLVCLALVKAIPSYRQTYPILIMFLGPILATAILSWVWQPMYFYRPMMAVVPPLLSLVADALLKIHRRNLIAISILCLPLLASTTYRQFTDARGLRQPERDNAAIIADNWLPGDCIFNMNVGSAITGEYYLPDKPQFIWAGPAALYNGALSTQTQEILLLDRCEFENLPGSCQRVWLNWWSNPLTSAEEDAEAERLIAQYHGQKFHTFVSNDIVNATLWILRRQPCPGENIGILMNGIK